MIYLIRVYDAGDRVIHSQALDNEDIIRSAVQHSRPDLRCLPVMTWVDRMHHLAYEYDLGQWIAKYGSDFQYEHGKITLEHIYPTPTKKRNK